MFVNILLFLLGFACLIFGGDWFVDGSVGIARRFRVPEILIGATIVSIGTTLPEVMVSTTSAIEGSGAMSYGNAIGSIICNTALIAALTIAIRPSEARRKTVVVPIVSFFIAAIFYVVNVYAFQTLSRTCGIILLAMFVAYMFLTTRQMMKQKEPEATSEEENEEENKKTNPLWKDILLLVVGAALIAVGARLLVDNGTSIATELGIPATVIALTFVALGTSLPELITAITALVKGHSSLSLGNIIGANLFNLVLVSGTSVTISPFDVPEGAQLFGMNSSFVIDIPLMICVMGILTIPVLVKEKLYRWQGISMLVLYTAFVIFQFVGGFI